MYTYLVKHVESIQELKDAFALRRKVFVEEQQVPEEIEIDEFENTCEHFVAYDEAHVPVGAGRLRPLHHESIPNEKPNDAKVERICVSTEVRGKGAGELIMKKIEEKAKAMSISTLLLHSQDHAEHFYNKLGYITISEPFDEAGILHVKMIKEL